MSRFAALAGIGRLGINSQNPELARQYPRLIIRGASGNCVSVPMMSGGAGTPRSFDQMNQIGMTQSHAALAWGRNEIVLPTKSNGVSTRDLMHAWQPYGQPSGEGLKRNDNGFSLGNNESMTAYNMFDGHNWKICNYSILDPPQMWGVKTMPGGQTFWTGFTDSYLVPKNYGAYLGDDPFHTASFSSSSVSGWKPLSGAIGGPQEEVNYSAHYQTAPGGELLLGGILHRGTDVSADQSSVDDVAFFKDSIYYVTQFGGLAMKWKGKGTYLWTDEMLEDTRVGDPTESSYTAGRLTDNLTGGSQGRCLSVHNDQLFMLSNQGKVHDVRPNTVKEVADLTNLSTFSSSGVFGGAMPTFNDVSYFGTSVRRCFITSFNQQLHAFLNFQSTFRTAKDARGIGRGIMWATSFDGINWTDQSPNLPTSGIHSPSGGGVTAGNPRAQVVNWLTTIRPYKFSGFTGQETTPIPNESGGFPQIYGEQTIGSPNVASGVEPAQPSGFIQKDIPLWTSGNLLETNTKPFDQMKVSLLRGAMSGCLYPTEVAYPSAFSYQHPVSGGALSKAQGGVFLPSGVGASGFDYTGCENYHVSGYVDDRTNTLQLAFTNDFAQDGGTMFFELNAASGWKQRNHLVHSKQTNGYIPIMLYDPQVIIPSGDVNNPNPRIDEVNRSMTLDYSVYDWPFWNTVDVVSEYSTDYGLNWSTIKRQKNLSTGSLQTDPSGVKGVQHTLNWNYATEGSPPLSKNQFYPHTQIRLTAIDPNFDPKELSS